MSELSQQKDESVSRRRFVAGAAAAGAAAALPVELSAQVAGSDAIKVGMIGMGGRGSGALAEDHENRFHADRAEGYV